MNLDFSNLTNALGWALVHFLWQGSLIAIATAFLLLFTRNAKAQTRYMIACAGLLACVAVPVSEILQSMRIETTSQELALAINSSSHKDENISIVQMLRFWFGANINWIVMWWATAVALLGLRLSLGILWLRGYSHGKRGVINTYWQQQTNRLSQQFGMAKPIAVRVVQDLKSPITIGWISPMILIPASLVTGMAPAHLEALIAHELAHILKWTRPSRQIFT
jgi:D-alanyl-D-alanine endopeptidase (penicillin-binding protein 7)